jgi:hypothetical protein
MEIFTKWVNILSIIYVSIPLFAVALFSICYLFGKAISKEFLEKFLEFGKWYMVSIAIVFAVKILDNSFTDRETSIKEIAIYERYATNILEADNIEKRWKLAEYFASVTPSENLRNRWLEYKELIKPEYDELIILKKRKSELILEDTLSKNKQVELLNIEQKINSLNTKLVATPREEDLFVIVYTADVKLDQAEFENSNLQKAGITEVLIVNKGRFYYNISTEYDTKNEASMKLESARGKVRADAYITNSSKFCNNKIQKGSYYLCQ